MSFQYATENHPRLKNPRQTDAHLKATTAHLNPKKRRNIYKPTKIEYSKN